MPAADTEDALRHELAAPSTGINGGTNSPSEEVASVVDLVLERPSEPSAS